MTVTASGDVRERLARRYQALTDVLDGAGAERSLAVFLAWRRGLGAAEIAEVTRLAEPEVLAIVQRYQRDEDAVDYQEGPRWVELWPHEGWGVSR